MEHKQNSFMALTMIPDVLSFQISYSNVQTRQFTLTNYPPNPSMNALMFNAYALSRTDCVSHSSHTSVFNPPMPMGGPLSPGQPGQRYSNCDKLFWPFGPKNIQKKKKKTGGNYPKS